MTYRKDTAMSERRLITKKPGEIIDFETVFELNPAIEENEPVHKGRMVRVDYTTSVYEYGVTYPKYCNVYLPWCYDENDRERRYNVLYYQHGNTCDPELFNTPERLRLFDNLFDSGEIDPCIIVCTTYYFDPQRDEQVRRTTGLADAGDNDSTCHVPNFYREVIEDIIPAVETRFHTYLTDKSPAGLRATRDHRAFTGYSRGACCTWYMLHNAFEFFRWYAPMSCMTTAGHDIFKKVTEEEVIDYITSPIRKHPDLPFFIYCTNGDPEKDIRPMNEQLLYLSRQKEFSYGTDPEKNNFYYAVSEYYHSDLLVPYYYWNSLKVLFKAGGETKREDAGALRHAGTQTLETERLILRRFTPDDAEAMYRNWASSDNVTKYLTWPAHSSADVSRMLLGFWMKDYDDPRTYHWGLTLKATGEVIGDISVVHLNESASCAELGWCIGEAYWGKGFMPEAAHAVRDYLFDVVGFGRIEACHDVNNPKSGRVMQKIGMTCEGIRRKSGRNNQGIVDVAYYGMLKDDPRLMKP